jgi:superfamily II DNA or RNA helicase
MNAIITILDSVHCKVEPKEAVLLLREHLSFDKPYWKKGRFCRIEVPSKKYLIGKSGQFYSGLYCRALEFLEGRGVSVSTVFHKNYSIISPRVVPPCIKEITFREDQEKFITDAINKKRGVISSPTGSGKTIIIGAIASCFPDSKIVIISHTTTIAEQTSSDLKGYGFKDSGAVYSAKKPDKMPRIVVTTNQSFVNKKDTYHEYDVVIIDECHIGFSNDKTNNCKILTNMIAPYKFAVTATLPKDKEASLVLEEMVGPLIGHLSLQEAIEKEILAEGYVQLVKVPRLAGLEKEKSYKRIYDMAIVNNRARNRMICQMAKAAMEDGMSVLILTGNSITHGENIGAMMACLYGIVVPFIYGEVKAVDRLAESVSLNQKSTKCVIANKVWREGTNIPSLDVLINAAGERADTATLQRIGRVMRRTKDKTVAFIVDFLDTGRYISDHAIDRIGTYIDNGLRFL